MKGLGMEQKWICFACKERKHKDCEGFNEEGATFCECLRCVATFHANVKRLGREFPEANAEKA